MAKKKTNGIISSARKNITKKFLASQKRRNKIKLVKIRERQKFKVAKAKFKTKTKLKNLEERQLVRNERKRLQKEITRAQLSRAGSTVRRLAARGDPSAILPRRRPVRKRVQEGSPFLDTSELNFDFS